MASTTDVNPQDLLIEVPEFLWARNIAAAQLLDSHHPLRNLPGRSAKPEQGIMRILQHEGFTVDDLAGIGIGDEDIDALRSGKKHLTNKAISNLRHQQNPSRCHINMGQTYMGPDGEMLTSFTIGTNPAFEHDNNSLGSQDKAERTIGMTMMRKNSGTPEFIFMAEKDMLELIGLALDGEATCAKKENGLHVTGDIAVIADAMTYINGPDRKPILSKNMANNLQDLVNAKVQGRVISQPYLDKRITDFTWERKPLADYMQGKPSSRWER